MTIHLRDAVEKMKQHYIKKILQSGAYENSEDILNKFTLSELKEEYKNLFR